MTVPIAKAPGDGLMLEKVGFLYHNEREDRNEMDIQTDSQREECESFRNTLVGHIAQRELKHKAFLNWLTWFDENSEEYI